GPDGRVAALSAALVAATLGAHAALLFDRAPLGRPIVPVWLLAVMFAATEGFAIHVRRRRGGHAISLSEIPLVLGLVATGPTLLVLARLVGGVIGLAGFRRQRGVKLAFNLALLGAQATTAVVVFRVLAGAWHGL